ncbi:retrovirus-related pol polyprotein from transposon TNT 1-94 [Tanacetum coccineum]
MPRKMRETTDKVDNLSFLIKGVEMELLAQLKAITTNIQDLTNIISDLHQQTSAEPSTYYSCPKEETAPNAALKKRAITNVDIITAKGPVGVKIYKDDDITKTISKFKVSNLYVQKWKEMMDSCGHGKGKGCFINPNFIEAFGLTLIEKEAEPWLTKKNWLISPRRSVSTAQEGHFANEYMTSRQNQDSRDKEAYQTLCQVENLLDFMRPFGCPVTILNNIDHLGKFDGKANEGFFVGYSTNSKSFRVFNSRTRIVEENIMSIRVNTPNIAGSGPNWLFDIYALTNSMNYKPVVAGNQSNGNAEESKKVIQAMKDPSWIQAMQDELLQFKLQKVWTQVDLLNGKRAIGTKWVYRNKKDEKGIVIKNKATIGCQCTHHRRTYGVPDGCQECLSMRGKIDKNLFIKRDKGDILLVQVYVDDIIFGSTKKSLCTEFEKMMHKKFQMSSMGELTFFLGTSLDLLWMLWKC